MQHQRPSVTRVTPEWAVDQPGSQPVAYLRGPRPLARVLLLESLGVAQFSPPRHRRWGTRGDRVGMDGV